jgi:hypothetical protein
MYEYGIATTMFERVTNFMSSVAVTATKCLVVCLAVFSPGPANAHGYLAFPAARNVQHNSNYCASCLNAGGPGVVFSKGLPGRHGVCGDPWNAARDHEAGGKFATPRRVAAVFNQGQTFKAKITLTANHIGRWSLRLCAIPPGSSDASERRIATQGCFDKTILQRADGRGPFTLVPKNVMSFDVVYRLPRGLKCERCVMQWVYETGYSCTPKGMKPSDLGLPVCGTQPTGEAFWNCADVSIR